MSELQGGDAAPAAGGGETASPSVDTATVAANTLAQLEGKSSTDAGGDGDVTVSGDAPIPAVDPPEPAAPKAEPVAPPPPPADLTEEEKLLREFGFKQAFKPDGREHWIARSKVLQMLGSGLKRSAEKWTAERAPLEAKVKEYESDRQEMYADILGDPQQFLTKLARHDPRYQPFVGGGNGQPAPHAQPPTTGTYQARTPPADLPAMPPPDLPLSDGTSTYSLDGVQKQLIPWLTQAITASIKADLKAEREQEQRQTQTRQQATAQRQQKVQAMMQEAQTWPMFGAIATDGKLTPFQQDVMTAFMGDKSLSLHAAYMKVAGPRFTEDDATRRARLLKELDEAPRSTATPRTAVDAPRAPGPIATRDVAARTFDRLSRGR